MHIQIIGLNAETRGLQLDLNQAIVASLTQEAKIADLKSVITALLLQAQDFDATDKYTFGLVSALLDGRNAAGISDPDPIQFAILVLDDFTDDQKIEVMKAKYADLSDADKIRKFDTAKVNKNRYKIFTNSGKDGNNKCCTD